MSLRESLTTAGTYPTKLINALVPDKTFKPLHLSVNLTNKCNLNCSYCSGADRMEGELSVGLLDKALEMFPSIQAVTFTGGGEPTLHPYFRELALIVAVNYGKKLALITNGTQSIPEATLFEWIRVSIDGERKKIPGLPKDKKVSFSWVWQDGDHKNKNLLKLIAWANAGKIGHLRIVSDIYTADKVKIPDYEGDNVICQPRDEYTRGTNRCWTGLIWPKMDVDGTFYACCGNQYAFLKTDRRPNMKLNLGDVYQYSRVIRLQVPFNGAKCQRCFYSQRNQFLNAVKKGPDLKNPEFC